MKKKKSKLTFFKFSFFVEKNQFMRLFFTGGGSLTPIIFGENLLAKIKLGRVDGGLVRK